MALCHRPHRRAHRRGATARPRRPPGRRLQARCLASVSDHAPSNRRWRVAAHRAGRGGGARHHRRKDRPKRSACLAPKRGAHQRSATATRYRGCLSGSSHAARPTADRGHNGCQRHRARNGRIRRRSWSRAGTCRAGSTGRQRKGRANGRPWSCYLASIRTGRRLIPLTKLDRTNASSPSGSMARIRATSS